jgi:hypothetical protein
MREESRKNLRILLYFGDLLEPTYCPNMPSSEKLFPQKTLAHIFHKYHFIQSHIGSFVTKVAKIHQVKKSNTAD